MHAKLTWTNVTRSPQLPHPSLSSENSTPPTLKPSRSLKTFGRTWRRRRSTSKTFLVAQIRGQVVLRWDLKKASAAGKLTGLKRANCVVKAGYKIKELITLLSGGDAASLLSILYPELYQSKEYETECHAIAETLDRKRYKPAKRKKEKKKHPEVMKLRDDVLVQLEGALGVSWLSRNSNYERQ